MVRHTLSGRVSLNVSVLPLCSGGKSCKAEWLQLCTVHERGTKQNDSWGYVHSRHGFDSQSSALEGDTNPEHPTPGGSAPMT